MTVELFPYFARSAAGKRASTLLKTHSLTPKKIFESVLDSLLKTEPPLIEGRLYTTEKVCGPLLWNTWTRAERHVAGMCMSFYVRNGLAAFATHRTPSGKGTKSYRATKCQAIQS